MKKQGLLIGLFMAWGIAVQAVVQVENVGVAQQEGTKLVAIHYDVSSTLASAVDVSVLLYDGENQIALSSLSGDVGEGVATGAGKTILWDAGADWNGQVRSCLQVWVVADDGTDTNPLPAVGSKLVLAGSNSGTDPDFGSYALTLDGGLLVDQAEVASNLWVEVYDWALANGYDFDNEGNAASNNHPVVAINWYDSVKWCNARSEKEGFSPVYQVGGSVYRTGDSVPVPLATDGYRLPTVGEWQYMARGCRTGSRFPWGDFITHSNANYFSVASSYDVSPTRGYHPGYSGTSPGDAFAANGLGLHDMAANVWEWCWDTAPEGRYLAGGSWQDSADSARCGATLGDAPGNSRFNAGFRTVRSAAGSFPGVANLAVDTRDYTLSVSPDLGNPQPTAGVHTYAWRSSVNCSVDSAVLEGGTNFTLLGWTGTGSVPAAGTTNWTSVIVLDDLESSIAWNWEANLLDGDTDGDTIPDAWELAYSGSITGMVASADLDGDRQSNIAEFIAGTNPTNAASLFQVSSQIETNGMHFVVEWTAVTGRVYSVLWTPALDQDFQPLETGIHYPQSSYTDTVHSAESGGYYRVVVVLESYDADGDGLPNDWEIQYAVADAQADADNDGFSNLLEFIAGTNPTNDASFFTSTASLVETNGASYFVVEWNAIPNRIYKVRWRESLMEDYQLLADGIEYPQNSYTNMLDTGTGFYRVDVRLK